MKKTTLKVAENGASNAGLRLGGLTCGFVCSNSKVNVL